MTTPERGLLFHFTHIDNLASVVTNGLASDSTVQATGQLQREVGDQGIKARRRARVIGLAPGGVVADYVPFYFAARSPMLLVIHSGNVPNYQGGQADVVYLVTSADVILELKSRFLFTDRNATLRYADFRADLDELDEVVDWDVMQLEFWNDTSAAPDRKERRMAEFLVYEHVPWAAIEYIAVYDESRRQRVEAILAKLHDRTPVRIMRNWYY